MFCQTRTNQLPPFSSRKFKPKTLFGQQARQTSKRKHQENGGTGSPSLSSLSPTLSNRHPHHPRFYRFGGTSQIRAILRSETDPIVLEHQSLTEEGAPRPVRESMKLTAGGLDEMSYVTRLIPATSFVMREDTFRRTSGGKTYLPEGDRFWVKTAKHKRTDELGKDPRTKTRQDPDALPPLGLWRRRGRIPGQEVERTHQSAVIKSSDCTARNAIT